MHHSPILTCQTLRGAALAIALLFAGTDAAVANDVDAVAPAATIAHILPGDREIARIEALDPANAGISFVMSPPASALGTPKMNPESINICIPCANLS